MILNLSNKQKKYFNSQKIKIIENLIETPEFKKWFGNSKIVDKSGKPMVVYHGTPNVSFSTFNINKIGSTSDAGMWGKGFYFTDDKNYALKYSDNKGKILSVYLSIKNPYIIKSKSDIPNIDVPEETIEDLEKADENYSKLFTQLLKKKGHDGVLVQLNNELEIVAFDPKQIKAIDNKGTFNPNSTNIYERNGNPNIS